MTGGFVADRPGARPAAAVEDPVRALRDRFGQDILTRQETKEDFPVLWIKPEASVEIHRFLKDQIDRPYALLTDLLGIDETVRDHREGQPDSGVTVASHLLSPDRNADIRLKLACNATRPACPR